MHLLLLRVSTWIALIQQMDKEYSLPKFTTVKSNAHSTWDMYTLYTLGAVYLESLRAQARTEASFVQQDAEEMVYFHSRAKI